MADLIENCRRHRGMIGLLTVLGAFLLGASALQQEFRLVGSDVTLVPKYTGDLKEITWILNGRTLVEIVLKPQEETLIDRTSDRETINKTNGALTKRNLTTGDSGLYKAKVILMNDSIKVTEIRLTVRDCPDQPIISVRSTKDQFELSCKSFSPDITYEWFNQATSVSKSPFYAEPKKNGTLTCVVDNKVCNKNSSINFYIPAQPKEKLVNDDVTLVPQYIGDPSEIIWKVNGKNLVEMELKPQVDIIFHRLQDRATISHTDGSLTIRHLTMEDYVVYTAVVLVNSEYYYTEIRLAVLKPRCLSEGHIAILVFGTLFLITIIIHFIILLWNCRCRKSRRLSEGDIAGIVSSFATTILWNCRCRNKKGPKKPSTQHEMTTFEPQDPDIEGAEESERCITVQFCNDVKNGVDESQRLLEEHSKRIQSPRLTIHWVQPASHGNFTAEALMSDGEKCTFKQGKEITVMIELWGGGETFYVPNTKHVKELVWKKDKVTQFEWAISSLKLHASDIKLKPGSVTVYNAEGKKSYRVKFQLEGYPVSKSITFHPSKMTGKDQITWKKDSQPVNIGGNRIKCDPNGDLTIYNATSEDKGKYTVQCIDKKLDQEFILHL